MCTNMILDICFVCVPCSRIRWIVGLECDGKGQVPAGSERGQHPQHFTLHLLDFVSGFLSLCKMFRLALLPLIRGFYLPLC